MSSRDAILTALRRNSPKPSPLPEAPEAIRYADPGQQFGAAVESVGGKFARVADFAALSEELRNLGICAPGRKIVSLVPAAAVSNVALAQMEDPHELEGVDMAILPGEFGVAENGAVWVPGSTLGPHRAIFVIAQHLVLVVPAGEIVHTMHEAYQRIGMERPGFGVFISGPSKTADIEQSLVIGAHGARSCTVFVVGSE